jgi:hypothetical protein
MKPIEVSEKEYQEIISRSVEEPFKFFMPMEKSFMVKSLSDTEDDKDPTSWKVGGYASTDSEDLDGECVVPGGIDTSYFLKDGLLTWDHKPGPEAKVGTPTDAYTDRKGFFVKGFLWRPIPAAQNIRLLMKTFAEHPEYNRHIGWSIEGKTLRMEGNRIVKSWLKDCTLTANPINTNTYATLVKSMEKCDYYKIGNKTVCEFENSSDARQVLKALEAGQEIANQTGGDALRVQDLERKLKILTNRDGLSEDELCEYAMQKSGLDRETASRLVEYAKLLKTVEMKKTFYPSAPAGIV